MAVNLEQAHRIFGIPVADGLRERNSARMSFLKRLEEKGEERWGERSHIEGDYDQNGLVNGPHEYFKKTRWDYCRNVRENEYELHGLEAFLERQAQKLKELKGGTPIVMLDLGGMQGASWSRLAKRFEGEVLASKMAFVVSNLAYDPQKNWDTESRWMRKDRKEMLESTRPLVHFIQADPSQLRRIEVALPDGTTIPLRGNVDVVHEQFSVHYWSYVPELEILQTASLLSPYGTYIVEGGDYPIGYLPIPGRKDLDSIFGPRLIGKKLADQEMLERFQLQQVTQVEEGTLQGQKLRDFSFYLWRKPDAPAVEVNK